MGNGTMLRVEKRAGYFVLRGDTYPLRDAIRGAGWRWNAQEKFWWTTSRESLIKLVEGGHATCDPAFLQRPGEAAIHHHGLLRVPEGKAYLPYQAEGIRFLLERDRAILADEMGLGKTIQAIGVLNNHRQWHRALIICPASLRLVWRDALEQWLLDVGQRKVGLDDPSADINITSYEMAVRHEAALRAQSWDFMICDECHYLKNSKSKRTKAILGKGCRDPIGQKRIIMMSGTPMMNRPIELWPLLRCCDPEGLGKDWFFYVKRFCAAYQNHFGWVLDGASHLDELRDRLRLVMIRRKKEDVLKELPAVTRQIIPLGSDDLIRYVSKKEEQVINELWRKGYVSQSSKWYWAMINEYSSIRHDVARAKVPAVIDLVKAWAEEGHPMVIMCHHTDVADSIGEAVGGIVVHGKMNDAERHRRVEAFQGGEGQILVATMASCATGLTMTRARQMIFAELDWVPATIRQSEARIHRIGQHHPVHYLYLVVPDSMEYQLAKKLAQKEEVVSKTLDGTPEQVLWDIFVEMAGKVDQKQMTTVEML